MEPGTSSQSASGEPSIAPHPDMTARAGSILQDLLSLSAEERSKILRLLNSPSDAGPSSAPPPTPGLSVSASTPETAAGLSTSDPALPPTPSAIPAPHPQTPAPLHAAPECDASSIPQLEMSARVKSSMQDFLSFSAEEKDEFLRLILNSSSDVGPWPPPPPASGLPASTCTPETAAVPSTSTDPTLPPTPSAIPAPHPQTPAPLHAAPECDASSIPSEGERRMSLCSLEELLGVTEEDVKKGEVVSEKGWNRMKSMVTADGVNLLMRAAEEGAQDCVEFLLRCGDDVNARTKQWCGAVDYAFKGDHSKVALLLFRWDSRLPTRRSYEREMFQALLEQDDEVRKLFEERDLFHDELMKENLAIVEKMIDTFNGLRYCVSSKGHSALYTAGYDFKFHAWALLKSRGFEYLEEEKEQMGRMEENEGNKGKFNRALGKYFVPMDKCHVQRMLKKSLVRGDLKRDYRDQIRRIYEDIDSDPMTSLLLQFLQSDPHLEVVFDVVEKDIRCIFARSERGCFGVTDFEMNRVYVSTAFGEHCDAVGNLAHELSHKVMFDLFKNDGLPYRKCDEESKKNADEERKKNADEKCKKNPDQEMEKNADEESKKNDDEESKKNADEERKKNDDEKSKNAYDDIVRKIMSKDRIDKCDVIIKRVKDYEKEKWPHELIVRVAEMVAKYKEKTDAPNGLKRLESEEIEAKDARNGLERLESEANEAKDARNGLERLESEANEAKDAPNGLERLESEANEAKDTRNGLERLESEANELLEYYLKFVQPQIEKHIEENRKKHWMPTVDLLSFPEILSKQIKKHIDVECVHPPHSSRHNGIRFLRVSNLKLGLRHLEKVSENLVCMDWSVYTNAYKSFQYQLERGYIKNMAVVWDEHMGIEFCRGKSTCKHECTARDFEPYGKFVTLIIPKDFNVHDDKVKTNEYGWSDLSTNTKDWVLKKMVSFQGSEVLLPLRQLLEGVVGEGKAEGWMKGNVSPGYLSMLIDQEKVIIGGDVVSALQERGKELLREHPECFIQRKTRVRPIQLSWAMFERRKNDAFFIRCSRKSDLPQEWIGEVKEWNSDGIPDDTRCFLLDEDWNAQLEEKPFKGIFENLRKKSPTERKWLCLHFFTHEKENNTFSHVHSEMDNGSRALIFADEPGNGKSVYVNAMARDEKKSSPFKWIHVVELTLREKELAECKKLDVTLKENIEEMIFKFVIGGVKETKMSKEMVLFEKKIFKHFCQSEEKVSLYVDGVDEVCPPYRGMINSFLKGVLETTKVKLVVSCRIHECATLEENLTTISQQLDPYSEKELIRFLDFEWNAKLNSLRGEGRQKTVSAILSNMKKENPSLIQSLESFMEKKVDRVNLNGVAIDLIEVGKSNRRTEDNVMAMPLIAWIASQVAFEENLNISSLLKSVNLYKKFIEMKIDFVYVTDKAGTTEFVVAEELREGFKSQVYDSLKKFATFFFLRENESRVEKKDMKTLIRVGLVAERDGVNAFVHRTIGEYILSLVLLDGEVKGEKLTHVLLKEEFHQVRRFLDGQLPSFGEERSSHGEEGDNKHRSRLLNLPKIPSEGEDAIISFKKCSYLSISERNEGISRNLMESCGEYVERVVYEEAKFDVRELNLTVDDSCDTTKWNAFTLFGEIILGNVKIGNERTTITSRIQCLRLLSNFLHWIKGKDNSIGRFEGVLTDQKLVWMGFGKEDLWKEEDGRILFELLLEFLRGVKSVLGESVKKVLMAEESESLFNNAAVYSMKSFVSLLDTYLEKSDFDDLLLPSSQNTSLIKCNNVVCAWTTVAMRSGVEGLQLLWDWLRSKMETPERMKRFLRRKDGKGRNALFTSFCNREHPNVSAHVWKLCGEVCDGSELKEYLFNTFCGVEFTFEFNKFSFYVCIIGLLSIGFLNEDDVARLFLSKDERGEYYLLDLYSFVNIPSPSLFSKVQHFFFERLPSKEETVRNMRGHYRTMTRSCFFDSSWIGVDVEFECEVESAFEAMRPSVLSFPPFRGFRLDGEGKLVGVVHWITEKRVNVIQFKAFGVLLRRQVEMEQGMLGREEAVERLEGEWGGMFIYLPFLHIEGQEGKNSLTRELSVRFTFAVLSEMMTKEEIAGILLCSGYHNPLPSALYWSDPMAFLALYDIARWCMAEDALWRLHAVEWGGETVLKSLLKRQKRGDFAHIEEVLPYENASPEATTSS